MTGSTVSTLLGPASSLLAMAWDEVSPGSLNNQIRQVAGQLTDIKTHLGKIEQAIIFGRDIKTLEYLVTKYSNISDKDDIERGKWAETALEYGSDGFDRSINSLKAMIEGTSQIFADSSIFATIAANDTEEVCNNIDVAFDYLVGLWTTSHAVWAQAYRINKQYYATNAKEKKIRAESKIEDFMQIKDESLPDHCHCFQRDIFYADVDHLLNPSETVSVNVKSARSCQIKCKADVDCKVWTFHKKSSNCFMHNNDNNELQGEEL
jgi:hypothetical protein